MARPSKRAKRKKKAKDRTFRCSLSASFAKRTKRKNKQRPPCSVDYPVLSAPQRLCSNQTRRSGRQRPTQHTKTSNKLEGPDNEVVLAKIIILMSRYSYLFFSLEGDSNPVIFIIPVFINQRLFFPPTKRKSCKLFHGSLVSKPSSQFCR